MSARWWIALAGAAALGIGPAAARGQNPPPPPPARVDSVATDSAVGARRPRLLVTGIAGSTIYVSLDPLAPDPLGPGAIWVGLPLDVSQTDDGAVIGRLVVVEQTGGRLLTRFDGEPFPVTRGTVLYLAGGGDPLAGPRDRQAVPGDQPVGPGGDRSTVTERGRRAPDRLSTTSERSARPRRLDRVRGPRLSGLLSFESDLRRSSSRFTGPRDGTIERNFATPGGRLRATLSGLPAGLRIHTSLRAYRRERDSRRSIRESQVQIFEAYALANPRGSPITLQGGRFLNRHEAFTGYWDGGLLRVGGRRFGIGAAVGWEPTVREERLDRSLFKYGAFMELEGGAKRTRFRASLSAVRIDPVAASTGSDGGGTGSSAPQRTIIGASQRLTVGAVRLQGNVEAEHDPATSRWLVSRARLGATVRAGRVTLRGTASRLRGPAGVAFDPSLDPRRGGPRVGPSRDRVGAGASLRIGSGSIGGDVTLSRDRLERTSRTVAGHIALPRMLPAGVRLRLNGFYWQDERTNSVASGFAAISRRFGNVRADLGYRFDRSERAGLAVLSHGLQVGLSIQGSNGWRYDMNGFARRGADLQTDRLYTRLSKSF